MTGDRGRAVTHVVTSTGFAGIERHVTRLAAAQQAQGWHVAVACPPGATELRQEAAHSDIDVFPAGGRSWVARLGLSVRTAPPAVLHVHDGRSALLGAAIVHRLDCVLARTQHFVHTASLNRASAARRASLAAHRRANREVAVYTAVSQSVLAAARTRGELPGGAGSVVPPAIVLPPVELCAAHDAHRALDAPPVAIFAGRLEPERELDILIRAVPIVLQTFPDCRFVMAGSGPAADDLRALAQRLDVAAAIEWPGWLADPSTALAQADVYVNTWSREAFGMAMAEAMALGLPAVAVDAGANPELVEPGVTGLLAEAGNPDALAASLVELFGDRRRLRQMGDAAQRRVGSLDVSATAAATIALYDAALAP